MKSPDFKIKIRTSAGESVTLGLTRAEGGLRRYEITNNGKPSLKIRQPVTLTTVSRLLLKLLTTIADKQEEV